MSERKHQFLTRLEQLLGAVPQAERREIMSDFESHFQEAHEAGRSEEEIFRSLGSEQAIARKILAQYGLELPNGLAASAVDEEAEPNAASHYNESARSAFGAPFGSRTASQLRLIRLDTDVVDVHLDTHDGEDISYHFDSFDAGQFDVREAREGDAYRLTVQLRRSGMKRFFSPVSGDLHFRIPASFGGIVELACGSGDAEVRQIRAERLDAELKSGDLTIADSSCGHLTARMKSGDAELHDCTCHKADMHTLSGDIRIFDLRADEFALKAASGDIELHRLAAQALRAELLAGDMHIVDGRGATWKFTAASGDLELASIAADVHIDVASGNISTKNIRGSLAVLAKSGEVECELASGTSQATIENLAGDVRLLVPSDMQELELEASTVLGTVSVRLPQFPEGHAPTSRFRGQLGENGPKVQLATKVGSISVASI
ncbi:DUF4097 family beta strand repeat-containing protein [Paenibacillus melissococcoides]|uniref:DUF4097 family beta strand repeat-containing protein n=1 Tax=Paenibacillus melissococcoides TaxID=2912268 RepID=A0ABN8UB61_9BACL|nr:MULTISPECIES: DUF4097 family beta strand repeat-containing protein [Paenibacillus]MEB9897375.1 DUF4097 family beta strand repeat-containing protein [Bacillus cereus]CAH8248399.1 DUF4097 family beta strand repeat-containing protein [Paenibacillus melissococcoides]CAH8717605.1 DUF4097 family beta strand repeat-containing protein [Paenibacillus melissococcoides]CAH8719518.1 DUF4097 family beta strand repeat-containing protein [Paenibacillus melissococcoides]